MARVRFIAAVVLGTLLGGCATYIYSGSMEAINSFGDERRFLVYWNKTDRLFWFDGAAGSVRLLTECSNNVVAYSEREDGIIFRRREKDRGTFEETALKDSCGQVLNGDRIRDLTEGALELTVSCEPVVDEFSLGDQSYLATRSEPYKFSISRVRTDDLIGDTPNLKDCRTNTAGGP